VVDRSASTRGVRQSLVGQEPGDPRVADLLARAVGFVESKVRVDEVGDARQAAVAVRASPGPLAPRSPGRRKGNRCIPDRAAVAGGPDPIVSPEAVARTFRRRDEAELRSDLLALMGRRTDLAAAQCAELFRASIVRLQDRYGVTGRIPPAAAIDAWIDAVVLPDPGAAIAPAVESVPYTPDPKAIALLTGPASDVNARGLLALAGRRRDLSDLQRHELYLAGLVHLVVRKAGFIVQPTRKGIFAWIDIVAPMRIPPALTPARGQPGLLADPGDPPDVDQVGWVSGHNVHDDVEPQAIQAGVRRARGLPDPEATFHRALRDAINLDEGRLSKTAIAAHMGIDRKTLTAYIKDGLIPPPPWESLVAKLGGRPPAP
jgi:hypothetical protein